MEEISKIELQEAIDRIHGSGKMIVKQIGPNIFKISNLEQTECYVNADLLVRISNMKEVTDGGTSDALLLQPTD